MTDPTRPLLPRERDLLRGHDPDVQQTGAAAARHVGDALVLGETWADVQANQLTVTGLVLHSVIWERIGVVGGAWSELTARDGAWHQGHFTGTHFKGCTFSGTRLEGCTFEGCTFEGCTFENVRMIKCTFSDCQLRTCKLVSVRAELELRGCMAEDTDMAGTSLSGSIDRLEWMGGQANLLTLTELEVNALIFRGVELEQLELLGGRYQELVLRHCSGSGVALNDAQVGTLVIAACESLVMLRVLGGHLGALRLEGSVLVAPVLSEVEIDGLWATRSELHDASFQGVLLAKGTMLDGRIVGIVIEGGRYVGLALARTTIEGYLVVRGAEFQGLDLQLAPPPAEGLEVELDGPIYTGPGDEWGVWSGA